MPPQPMQQPLCAFPECSDVGCFGFREPGIANLAHRNPDALEVWLCGLHREYGPDMLQAKIEARAAARQAETDAGARARTSDMVMSARRAEGKLL